MISILLFSSFRGVQVKQTNRMLSNCLFALWPIWWGARPPTQRGRFTRTNKQTNSPTQIINLGPLFVCTLAKLVAWLPPTQKGRFTQAGHARVLLGKRGRVPLCLRNRFLAITFCWGECSCSKQA